MKIELNKKTDEILRTRLTDYVTALQTVCDILGLEGEWAYDPEQKALIQAAATPLDTGRSSSEPAAAH